MIKLHLGCGKRDFGPGWFHVDGANYPHIDGHNIKEFLFKDNRVEIIYASHVIEYFDKEEIIPILKEWYRVLKPGGILRLAVPDFEAMANLYVENKCNLQQILGPLYGKMKMNDDYIYHKTVYDKSLLTELLINAGFKDVRKWNWREVDHGKFDDHSQAYLPHMDKENGTLISLNIEAVK